MTPFLVTLLSAILNAASPTPGAPPLPPETIAVVLDLRITEAERGELDSIILWALLSRFARDNHLGPTDDELELALRRTTGPSEDEIAALIAQRELVRSRIKGHTGPPDSDFEAARRELQAIETRLQNLLGALNARPFNDRDYSPERAAHLKVTRWKSDKALHDRYGGRIAITASGHEPIDAYRAFLKEQEAAGAFRFADESIRDAFWAEWNDDAERRWLSEVEAERCFDQPWWLTDQPD